MVFETQIDQGLNPKLARVAPSGTLLSLTELKIALQHQYPGYRVLSFEIPAGPDLACAAYLQPPLGAGIDVAVDPYTGKALGVWDNKSLRSQATPIPHPFSGGRSGVGNRRLEFGDLLFLSVSGLILWWRSKIFRIDLQTSGPKFQYDLHSTIGVVASVFLLAFAWTGVVVHWGDTARAWAGRVAGVVVRPADPRPDSPPSGAPPVEPPTVGGAGAGCGSRRAAHHHRTVRQCGPSGSGGHEVCRGPHARGPHLRFSRCLFGEGARAEQFACGTPPALAYVTRLNREIHTGDIGGWPGRIVAAVFSLSLPVLAVSGPLLWWQRRQRR